MLSSSSSDSLSTTGVSDTCDSECDFKDFKASNGSTYCVFREIFRWKAWFSRGATTSTKREKSADEYKEARSSSACSFQAEASLELNLKNRPLRPSSFLQGEESNGYWSSEGYFDFDYTTRRELRQSRVRGGTHPKKEKRKPSNDGGWTKNQEGNSLICRYKRISQLTPLLRRSSQVSRKHRCKSSLTVQSRFFCNDRFTILLRHQPNNSSIK